jgi:putative membrane protein
MKAIAGFIFITLALMWALAYPQSATMRSQPAAGVDRKFASEAAAGSIAEIRLGELAQIRGRSNFTREFGEMMERDHSAGLNSLRAIASDNGYRLPSIMDPKGQATYNRLSKMSGTAFDKAYRSAMIKSHALKL